MELLLLAGVAQVENQEDMDKSSVKLLLTSSYSKFLAPKVKAGVVARTAAEDRAQLGEHLKNI